MKDVINPINTPDGLFHDGDQSTGVLGTIVTAQFQNDVQAGLQSTQNERISILKMANPAIVLDPSATNQLIKALLVLFLQSGNNFSEIKSAGAAAQTSARTNLGLGSVATESILPITKGGTGATVFDDARTNLGINRLRQSGTDTVIVSPSDNYRLFVADSGVWGVINNIGTPQPLAINTGGTGATTAAAARSNLGLGSAAIATVGNGAGQVPSMANFTSGPCWVKFPDGTIIQTGVSISGPVKYPTAISLPIPFTQAGFKITTSFDSATSGALDCPAFATTAIGLAGFYLMSSRTDSGSGAGANWIAIGK